MAHGDERYDKAQKMIEIDFDSLYDDMRYSSVKFVVDGMGVWVGRQFFDADTLEFNRDEHGNFEESGSCEIAEWIAVQRGLI